MSENNAKGILFAGITALSWSVVPVALKVVVQEVNPVTVVWFRFSLAFMLLLFYIIFKSPHQLKIIYNPPKLLIFAALALGANYMGILLGVKNTTPSTTQIVIQFGPVLLAVSGFLVYKEKLTRLKIIGFLIAIAGLTLFYFKQASMLVDEINVFNSGILWILFAAVTWAIYAVFQKQLVRNYKTQQLNLLIYGLPALLYTPFVSYEIFSGLSGLSWLLLIFLGMNTFVSYLAMSESLKYTQANKVSIIITLNPIITFIFMMLVQYYGATWIEHEHFAPLSIVGAALVITGAVIVVGIRNGKKYKQNGS